MARFLISLILLVSSSLDNLDGEGTNSCGCLTSNFNPDGCYFKTSYTTYNWSIYTNNPRDCTFRIIESSCFSCSPAYQPTFTSSQCSTNWRGEFEVPAIPGTSSLVEFNVTVICCRNPGNNYCMCVGTCDSCTICTGITSKRALSSTTPSTWVETTTGFGASNTTLSTKNESENIIRASITTPSRVAETTTIIGAVVGSVLGAILVILLVLMICCLLKKRSARKETDEYQGCTVDQGGALPTAFSFDNPEYSQPPSADSKKYEQLNPTNGIKKDANNYESLTHGDEYDNDIPSIVKDASDAKSYDNMINKKDVMEEPTNNVSSPGNVYTDFMGNNSMTGETENKSDPPVSGNDDTTLIDNSLYGSDKPAAETIQGNDDTILVDNSLYESGRD